MLLSFAGRSRAMTGFNGTREGHRACSLFGWFRLLWVSLQRVPPNSLCLQVSRATGLFSVQHWANRFPVLYAALNELCSVPYRILYLRDIGALYNGLDLQKVAGECRVGSAEYRSRIQGIQNLEKHLPAATLSDALAFLVGHRAGVGYRDHSDIPKSKV
jgi:hypothetical protein